MLRERHSRRQERSKTVSGSPKCWFTNSFFWPKLSGNNKDSHTHHVLHMWTEEYSYKEVRRWTVKAKVDIFEMDPLISQHIYIYKYVCIHEQR